MDPNALLEQAYVHHQQGDLNQALGLYRQVLEIAPEHGQALNLAGAAYAAQGDNHSALACLEKATRLYPDYLPAFSNLGILYHTLHRFDEAAEAQRRVIELEPLDVDAHNQLGIELRNIGKYQGAIESFERAIELDPNNLPAHVNLGNVFQDTDRMEEAADSYRRALALDSTFYSAQRGLGNALQRLERVDEAIISYRAALAAEPGYVRALVDLGGALVETGEQEEGATCLRQAIEQDPNDAYIHANLGIALHELGQFEAANESFDRALEIEPGNTHALSYKTISLHELGQNKEFDYLTNLDLLVQFVELPVPEGYDSIDGFNRELAEYAKQHPSLYRGRRQGITSELLLDAEGPVVILRDMIHRGVEKYIENLPKDFSHPFIDRAPSKFKLSGWANVLDAGVDAHVHPNAWLSGTYYVQTGDIIDAGDNTMGGCLEVGPPPKAHYKTENYPRRVVTPKEGHMAMFPSYVWHRILPFSDRGVRISYAFDVVPVV
jgi:tetratricopeptide (TPR) repeat protein